jgi:hypothetical protein
MTEMLQRPDTDEYGNYFARYITLVPEGDLLQLLKHQLEEVCAFGRSLTEEQGDFRYEPGKWSIKEIIGHIADTERVMSYRLLRAARGDKTPLPGFDQDLFVQGAFFERRSITNLLDEFTAVRQSTLALLASLPEEAWTRNGITRDAEMSARAYAYVIAGHALHHYTILEKKYKSAL